MSSFTLINALIKTTDPAEESLIPGFQGPTTIENVKKYLTRLPLDEKYAEQTRMSRNQIETELSNMYFNSLLLTEFSLSTHQQSGIRKYDSDFRMSITMTKATFEQNL